MSELLSQQMRLFATVATFGLLVILLAAYNWAFRKAEPKLELLKVLQERLRYIVLAAVFMFPAWFGCTQIENFQSYANLLLLGLIFVGTVVAFESALSVVFGYRSGGEEARVARPFRYGLRATCYGLLAYYLLKTHPDLAVFDSADKYALASLFITYLILHVTYTYFFKWVQWRHPLAVAVARRVRMWAYLLVLALLAFYAFSNFDLWPSLPPYERDAIKDHLRLALTTLIFLIVLDGIVAAVFDYYFPVMRRTVIPHLFRDLTSVLIYLIVILFVVGVVLRKDLSSLVLGSTVVSIIIGLALQETLGNFFAGLMLSLSRPYNLGDDLSVGDVTGRVEKIDWRSTVLRTQTGDYVILPNSSMAKANLQNFSAPTRTHARFVEVGCHYRHPPNVVKRAILEAAYSVHEVLSEPRPEVWLTTFADSSINYKLRFFLTNFPQRFAIESKVREAIWYRFSRDKLEIPFPMRNLIQVPPEERQDLSGEVRALLDKVDFLHAFQDGELDILARRIRYQLYARGEKICLQGEPGDSFYIIKSGRLRVSAKNPRGEVFLSIEMLPGQYFGEMALLTGEPRSATVEATEDSELLMLDKEDLRMIMRDNPQVATVISQVLAQRQLRTEKAREELEEERARSQEVEKSTVSQRLDVLSEQFMRKIRDFFSY